LLYGIELDLSIGPMLIQPGFIGPIEPPGLIGDGDDERAMFGPIDGFPGFGLDIRPLLIRFDDADVGGRGLNPG